MIQTSLAHYRILGKLGAGGMGEVYRAEDTKLKREVAIKVLPEAFAKDSDRMKRFEREAQVLASLNHPNIAAIYGLEESDGQRFLVLELVEGEDLADRLSRGAIPVDEAIQIAKQIAEGMEQAHEKGIIHRDLKPANVKVSRDGVVKILDFGLAKALEGNIEEVAGSDGSQSPTLSRPATVAGVILGTAAYMAPEQARGKTVDRRADIWAFGVVLYEMLTGKRLFQGETVSDTLAAVLKTEIDFGALPSATPMPVRALLRRCLQREPKERLRDVGDARLQLEDAFANVTEEEARRPVRLPWVLAALGIVLALVTLWGPWRRTAPLAPLVRTSIELGADVSLAVNDTGPAVALSPDGSLLAFVGSAAPEESPMIYLRRLDQLQANPLPGTEGATSLFFSPDGESIGFFTNRSLKKVPLAGGSPVVLADVSEPRGGSWSEDGTILFTSTRGAVGLMRVASNGGTPETLTKPDAATGENFHRRPQALPGGKAVLFTSAREPNYENANLVIQHVEGGERKVVVQGGYQGQYLPSGHLIYVHEGALFAVPFDLTRLEATSGAVPVLEPVVSNANTGGAQFGFSSTGTLVYISDRSGMGESLSIQWLDRNGELTPLRGVPGDYRNLHFSPDGKRLALDLSDGHQWDVWVYEWQRDTMSRLTFAAEFDGYPLWTPDGRRIAFMSGREESVGNLYWQQADGTDQAERLTESGYLQGPLSWHPNESDLAFAELNPETSWDVMVLPIERAGESGFNVGRPTAFLDSPFSERHAAYSPDGRWLAYSSNESGRYEAYVRPYPGSGGKWQISTEGGVWPTWSRNGRALFFLSLNQRLMVASYLVRGDSFDAEKPRLWSEPRIAYQAT